MNENDIIILHLKFKRHPNPPAIRLRKLLKVALRCWSMKCVDYRLIENSAVEPAKTPHQSNGERREGIAPSSESGVTSCDSTQSNGERREGVGTDIDAPAPVNAPECVLLPKPPVEPAEKSER